MSPPAASNARFVGLAIATALCYAIGYPLALIAHSAVGWVFVFLGGPLLLTLGVLTIRRLAARSDDPHR